MGRLRKMRANSHRVRMTVITLSSDISAFFVALALLVFLNYLFNIFTFDHNDWRYLLIIPLTLAWFTNAPLYPAVGLSPAEEIRLVTQRVSLSMGVLLLVLEMASSLWHPNRMAIFVLWVLLIFCILLCRWSMRILSVRYGWWGEPVAVAGRAEQVVHLTHYFLNRQRLGFIPALAIVCDETKMHDLSLPVIYLSQIREQAWLTDSAIHTLIIPFSTLSEYLQNLTFAPWLHHFASLVIVHDLKWFGGFAFSIRDFEGLIGLEAERSFTIGSFAIFLKRSMDIFGGLLIGLLSLPILLIAAICIRFDSPGPIFYTQTRIGMGGKMIRLYKLRTMVQNAEALLEEYLRTNPEARQEWEKSGKLRNDPRITRVGRFLRKFSLDELPQVYNILRGDMSLVGPRPLPLYHHEQLSETVRALRLSVRPGLTGLWQVSGRSDSGNHGMEQYDTYYVRHWSIWLDIYILLRTIWVVLKGEGAY
ncbi:MAG: exopolysaccharide biosynthesis polyprenyl glycosylphosphotransferase [Candidatus Methanomethylicaceae archaeon]